MTVLTLLAASVVQTSVAPPPISRVEAPFPVSHLEVVELGDREGLVLVGGAGELALWLGEPGDGAERPALGAEPLRGPQIADPDRCLIDLGRLERDAAAEDLVVTGPQGTWRYSLSAEGFAAEPERLARRARFPLHTARPVSAPILADVDDDGRTDLTLPAPRSVTLYWNRAGEEQARTWVRGGEIRVRTSLLNDFETDDLTDRLRSTLVVPRLTTLDVNGDGLPDLVVEEDARTGFHLQVAGEGFPVEPDVSVDLATFRDDTRGPIDYVPGGAVELDGDASLVRRDLDGDGIPDHVVFQGRKLWAFRSGPEGPQFTEPSMVLKSSEPITAAVFLDLDGDDRDELLLLRVEIPTVPSLILGLFSEWDVPIHANGYRNEGGGRFATLPFRSRELRLRLPPILGLARDPYALVKRFTEAGSRFRDFLSADLDGDGNQDLLLLDEERTQIEVYAGRGAEGLELSDDEIERLLREQLFESDETVWDTDRLLAFVGGVAAERVRRQTRGAVPSVVLRPDHDGDLRLAQLLPVDLDGDGALELAVVVSRTSRPGWRRIEVHAPL